MSRSFSMAIPHTLSHTEVKERIESAVSAMSGYVGRGGQVSVGWQEDSLHMSVKALGQTALGTVEAKASEVLIFVQLPMLLAPFKGKIQQVIAEAAQRVL